MSQSTKLVLAFLLTLLASSCSSTDTTDLSKPTFQLPVLPPGDFDPSTPGNPPPPPPTGPALALGVVALDFGMTAIDLPLPFWNDGSGTLNVSAAGNAPWLTLTPAAGASTGVADQVTLLASADRSGLLPGAYTAQITLTPDVGAPQTVPVTLQVGLPPGSLIDASRIAGVSPLGVSFRAAPNLTWIDHESLRFAWDFGDGVSAEGFLAAHVYELAGGAPSTPFSVQLTITQNGTLISQSSTTITVNPSSGATHCVSGISDFSNCPAGATQHAALGSAWSGLASDSRLLLHRGETFSLGATLATAVAGPVEVSAYGAGAKPEISITGDISAFDVQHDDWRFSDLSITAAGGHQSPAFAVHAGNFLSLRNTLHDLYAGFRTDGAGYAFATNQFYSHTDLTATLAANYLAGTSVNVLDSTWETSGASAPALTIGGAKNVLLARSTFISTAGPAALNIQGENTTQNPTRPGSDHLLVTRNFLFPGANAGPQSAQANEPITNAVFEKNLFGQVTAGSSSKSGLVANGKLIAIRNNLFHNVREATRLTTHNVTGFSANVTISGNTIYNPDGATFDHFVASLAAESVAVAVQNNLIHAVGNTPATKLIGGTAFARDHNIANFPNHPGECVDALGQQGSAFCIPTQVQGTALSPLFASIDPAAADFLTVHPLSPAIDAGVNLNSLFEDFSETTRPIDGNFSSSAECDIGAYEFVP